MKATLVIVCAFLALSLTEARSGDRWNYRNLRSPMPKVTPLNLKKKSETTKAVQCGLANVDKSKVVGGEEAGVHQFPWLVTVEAVNGRWFCTGSLISSNWVLTAAHCVDGETEFRIGFGVHNRGESNGHDFYLTSNNGFHHEDYSQTTLKNDIALIELPESVDFNEYVRPACLPSNSDADDDNVGDEVTVTGWGKTSDSSITASDTLQFAENIPVMENYKCNQVYGIITDSHLCIDTSDRRGVCNGDSGGPLNLPIGDNIYKQIGVTSFVSSLGCESGYPHGFTRVSSFLDWIEQHSDVTIDEM